MKKLHLLLFSFLLITLNSFGGGGGGGGADVDFIPASDPRGCVTITLTNTNNSASDWSFTPSAYNAATGTLINPTITVPANGSTTIYWTVAGDKQLCQDGNCVDIHSCDCNPIPADDMGDAPSVCSLDNYCGTTLGVYTSDMSSDIEKSGGMTVENNSWLQFVASATSATFNLNVLGGCKVQFGVYEPNPNTTATSPSYTLLTPISYTSGSGFSGNQTITASPLVIGNTYHIMIDGLSGAVCDYEINFAGGVQVLDATASANGICPGDPVTISVSPSDPGSTYSWTDNQGGGPYPNSSSISVNPGAATTYSVNVTGGACATTALLDVPITLNCVLPIELLGFTAECEDNHSILKWQTASEINNNYFVIEKSNDAINFNAIGNIDGAGNSSTILYYSFQDFDNSKNELVYYRLKQVDFNGDFSYSPITPLNQCLDNTYSIANSYFNNSSSELVIDYNASNFTNTQIRILDSQGKLIYNSSLELFQNNNQAKIKLNQLHSGAIYFVNIISPNSVDNFKIYISPK